MLRDAGGTESGNAAAAPRAVEAGGEGGSGGGGGATGTVAGQLTADDVSRIEADGVAAEGLRPPLRVKA